jgi:uncharacterized protein
VEPWRVVEWDGQTLGGWRNEIDASDVVINLAGRSVNCRYNAANRAEILESRMLSTRAVGQAIAHSIRAPRVWLQASTATIYAHRYDRPNDEMSGLLGGGEADAPNAWNFSIEIATAWERTFNEMATDGTRKIALRPAMTMSPDPGGVFDTRLGLTRRGLGGAAGDGRQFVSWIHYEDFIAAIRWLIDHDDVTGVVNLAAPNPLTNADSTRFLREAAGISVELPASRWMLEIGAVFVRTATELILKSRRVVLARLLQSGFAFKFPTWREAARDLYQQWALKREAGARAGVPDEEVSVLR